MIMQYIVSALRDAVNRALAVDREQQEQHYTARLEIYAQAQAEWMERHNERWSTAAKLIAAAVRKGKPVTAEMIPGVMSGYNRAPDTFDEKHPGDFAYVPDVELKTVANALDLVPDELIGVRDLAALGVRGSALRYVLGLAPVKSGKSTAVTE